MRKDNEFLFEFLTIPVLLCHRKRHRLPLDISSDVQGTTLGCTMSTKFLSHRKELGGKTSRLLLKRLELHMYFLN